MKTEKDINEHIALVQKELAYERDKDNYNPNAETKFKKRLETLRQYKEYIRLNAKEEHLKRQLEELHYKIKKNRVRI